MPDPSSETFGSAAWTLPKEDAARQAFSVLRGYVYQLHQSAAAWLALRDDGELYLEVAEDYAELIRQPGRLDDILRASQVKDTRESGSVTLNSTDIIDVIERLFRLKRDNPSRLIEMVFLTTSPVGKERKAPLASGHPGLLAWSEAATGGDVEELRRALRLRLKPGPLRKFVEGSTPDQLRSELIAPMKFICGAPNWQTVAAENRETLIGLRGEVGATVDMAERAYDAVFYNVTTAIIGSPTRTLDRANLRVCLERATTIALPSQVVADHFKNLAVPQTASQLDEAALRSSAQTLLDAGKPPSIELLFPDAPQAAISAFRQAQALRRSLWEVGPAGTTPARIDAQELQKRAEQKHLLLGPPGLGKSHTLWQLGQAMLTDGGLIPIFVPVAGVSSWDDVVTMIVGYSGIAPKTVFEDARVAFLIDGWSEFAPSDATRQKQRAMRALAGARVIAAAKVTDLSDGAFKQWTLEPFAAMEVASLSARARAGSPPVDAGTIDLLRLPLLLSMHILAGTDAVSAGDLLRQFHSFVSRGCPEAFTDALSGAAAASGLSGDRSFGRFMSELRRRATAAGIADPGNLLRKIGTIVERNGTVLPIHDLYWSWLCGVGMLGEHRIRDAIVPLATRQDIRLALQSGAAVDEQDIVAAVSGDVILAAALDRAQNAAICAQFVADGIEAALTDPRLAVRNRGGLAALASGRAQFLRPALDVLREVTAAQAGLADWLAQVRPEVLFPQRGIVADWLQPADSSLLINAIGERGGPEWEPWLRQMAADGKISDVKALGAALGCSIGLSSWEIDCLDVLLQTAPWELAAATKRGVNVALGRYLGDDYERIIGTLVEPSSSGWININRALVACADDLTFAALLHRFGAMPMRAQELLGFAVVDRGEPWVGRFQKVAFADPPARQHHKLQESASAEIDDAAARAWIAVGNDDAGWRVLIARHGNSLLPDLIAALPVSFGHEHDIPALARLRHLRDAPEQLVDELWNRLGSPMQPKAMHDFLVAMATVYPAGVASIVRFVADHPKALPAYHTGLVLRLYDQWCQRSKLQLGVGRPGGPQMTFDKWVVASGLSRWEEHFTAELLARQPDLAIAAVLGPLSGDVDKVAAVLQKLRGVKLYDAQLLERMLASPDLAALVPDVFDGGFDLFPEGALRKCIEAPQINQSMLLYRLSAGGNPLHLRLHGELLSKLFSKPLNMEDFRYLAAAMNVHPRHDVLNLLGASKHKGEDRWVWVVREFESARGERLIDEAGIMLSS